MRLLLVRHGQSQANIDHRIQGADDPLTPLGRAQAHALATLLAQRGDVTHIYASPLVRAFETATIIGHAVGTIPIPTAGLAEIDAGDAVGLTWDEWNARFPREAAALASIAERWPGGESAATFSARVLAAYDDILARHRETDDVVTLVAHGGTLAWISARLHGDPLDTWPMHRAIFANCSVSEAIFDPAGSATIGSWNQHGHLEAVLPG